MKPSSPSWATSLRTPRPAHYWQQCDRGELHGSFHPRTWNHQTNQFEDGRALFMRCSAWRDLGDHCAPVLKKGMPRDCRQSPPAAFLSGHGMVPSEPSWRCSSMIGPSLRYATAQVTRQSSGQGGFQGRSGGFQGGQQSIRAMATRVAKVVMPVARAVTTVAIRVVALDTPSSLPLPPTRPLRGRPVGNAGASDAGSFPRSTPPPFGGDDSDPGSDQYLPPFCQQQSISRFTKGEHHVT